MLPPFPLSFLIAPLIDVEVGLSAEFLRPFEHLWNEWTDVK